MSDCHSLNRHAKWNCLTAGGGSEIAGVDLLHSGMRERASKIYGSCRTSVFLSFSYSYISQPRLADCWQLHDMFAVTWLESEASDKCLVGMSLCDVQWQIHFRYYKYVVCPVVGDLVLFLVWPAVICSISLCFCFTIQEKMEKMTHSSLAAMAHSVSAMLEPDTGSYHFHWVQ